MYASVTSLYLNVNHTQRQRQKRLDTRLKNWLIKNKCFFYFAVLLLFFFVIVIVAVVQVSF